MPIKLQSSSGGSVTLDVPVTASNFNVTVPNASGTAMVSGNIPTFSAYSNPAGGSQSVSNNTWTKVQINTKLFDTANCFDSTTNYRFTPNVAGYYQINASLCLYGTSSFPIEQCGAIYVNGSTVHWIADISPNASLTSNNFSLVNGSTIVYLNGTTDYVELYGYYYGSGASASFGYSNASRTSRFSAYLVRAA
jgi:hypothetical protein